MSSSFKASTASLRVTRTSLEMVFPFSSVSSSKKYESPSSVASISRCMRSAFFLPDVVSLPLSLRFSNSRSVRVCTLASSVTPDSRSCLPMIWRSLAVFRLSLASPAKTLSFLISMVAPATSASSASRMNRASSPPPTASPLRVYLGARMRPSETPMAKPGPTAAVSRTSSRGVISCRPATLPMASPAPSSGASTAPAARMPFNLLPVLPTTRRVTPEATFLVTILKNPMATPRPADLLRSRDIASLSLSTSRKDSLDISTSLMSTPCFSASSSIINSAKERPVSSVVAAPPAAPVRNEAGTVNNSSGNAT